MSVAQMVSSGGSSERKKRDERHDATPRAEQRNGPAYREVRQALHDETVQPSLQHHAAGGQGQVQPPQHTQYPPGYAHGSSGELPYTETTQWLSGELPQTGRGHGNMQVGSGQMFGGNSTHDPTVGYPNATYERTYGRGLSGQLSYNASIEGLSGELPQTGMGNVNWCGAGGGMAQSAPDHGGPGGYEGVRAHAYPQTGYMPEGMPGGSGGQRRNEGGMAHGTQVKFRDGNNYRGNEGGGRAQSAPDHGGSGGHEGGQAHAYPRTGYVPEGMPGASGGQGRNEGGMAYGTQGSLQDGTNYSGNQRGGMAQSASDPGGPGGYEGGRAHAYPQTGYVSEGMPGGSGGQGGNEVGMAYGIQGNLQGGSSYSGNQQWHGNECQGYDIHGGQSQMGGGPEMGGGGNYGYGYGHGPGMMNGPYYGGGGYGGVQMAQPVDQDAMGLLS